MTTWCRHPGGRPDPLAGAGKLGQTVHPWFVVWACVVVLPIAGVGEAEAGAEVDDRLAGEEGRRERGGLLVRECEEYQVSYGQATWVSMLEGPAGQVGEMRMDVRHRGADAGSRGDRAEFQVGMFRDQAQEFTSRIPARSGDGDPDSHVPSCTLPYCKSMRDGDYLCKPERADGVRWHPRSDIGAHRARLGCARHGEPVSAECPCHGMMRSAERRPPLCADAASSLPERPFPRWRSPSLAVARPGPARPPPLPRPGPAGPGGRPPMCGFCSRGA